MDEGTGGEGAARRLDASEANRLAQEIDEAALNQRPVSWESESGTAAFDAGAQPAGTTSTGSVEGAPSAEAQTAGYDPLGSEERERRANLFPQDVVPGVEIGGSPEEQGALRDEYIEG